MEGNSNSRLYSRLYSIAIIYGDSHSIETPVTFKLFQATLTKHNNQQEISLWSINQLNNYHHNYLVQYTLRGKPEFLQKPTGTFWLFAVADIKP